MRHVKLGAAAPAEMAGQLRQPLLILQGGRDYQVTREDFDLWKKALADHPNVAFKWYPDLNHFFAPGQGKAVPLEYLDPNHVSDIVIADLVDWIREPRPGG